MIEYIKKTSNTSYSRGKIVGSLEELNQPPLRIPSILNTIKMPKFKFENVFINIMMTLQIVKCDRNDRDGGDRFLHRLKCLTFKW